MLKPLWQTLRENRCRFSGGLLKSLAYTCTKYAVIQWQFWSGKPEPHDECLLAPGQKILKCVWNAISLLLVASRCFDLYSSIAIHWYNRYLTFFYIYSRASIIFECIMSTYLHKREISVTSLCKEHFISVTCTS